MGNLESQQQLPWFYRWTTTLDHKKIGILYLWTTLFFFAVGGMEAMLIRIQLSSPGNSLLSPEVYNQIFTMHGTTMVFLVVMPVLIGFANYLVPLMIGARDMAFPRLNAFSYWLYLLGGILLHVSFLAGGAPAAGWFSYAPLAGMGFSSTPGIDYWVIALLVMGIGSVGSGINLIVTILTMRAEGMTMRRVPLFVWMIFVNSFLIVMAMPILNASIIMLLVDRQLHTHFFDPAQGGSALVWQHFFWAFGHPEVYIMALPAFGMISEMIPVFSRKPIFGYTFIAGSTVAIALLSFGVWAHHMFAVGLGTHFNAVFAIGSMLIAVPTGVKIFNWIATMWGGAIRYTTAMNFAVAFLVEFVIGGLSGVMFAVVPIDWQVTDSYFVVAHIHYVLFGGTLFAVFGAVYYWFPKISGRLLCPKLGKWHFWVTVIGFNLTFLVQHFLGLMGMPRRVYTYPDEPWWGVLNGLSTLGAILMFIGAAIFFYNIIRTLRRGKLAGDNPWNAWTLEWATTSPPPENNFERLPVIKSRRPLWDLKNPDRPDWKFEHTGPEDSGHRGSKALASVKLFLLSESFFFFALMASFVIFGLRATGADAAARDSLDAVRTGIFTFFLIASSGTVWFAERSLRKGKTGVAVLGLLATIGLGLVFLSGQGTEYLGLWKEGITVDSTLFASSFFTLTGFHAFHVLLGLVALGITTVLVQVKRKGAETCLGAISLYWHFVDVVWILVFVLVYLVK